MLTWGLLMVGLVLLVIGVATGIWIIIGIAVIVIIADVLLVVRRVSRVRRSGAEATGQPETAASSTPIEPTESTEDLDYIEKLKILAQTRDEGIITEEEFEKKKNEILRDST